MPRTRRRIAIAAAAVGNGIFGFSFMFSRMALVVASPFTMLMYRFVTAFVVLGLIAMWAKRTRQTGWLRFSLRAGQVRPSACWGCSSRCATSSAKATASA